VVGDGREIERALQAHGHGGFTARVEGREVDGLAAGKPVGVGGGRADVVGPGVEREGRVDVEVAEEGLSQGIAVGAGLARVDVAGARRRLGCFAAAGQERREEDED
jgi:hypothetical protein